MSEQQEQDSARKNQALSGQVEPVVMRHPVEAFLETTYYEVKLGKGHAMPNSDILKIPFSRMPVLCLPYNEKLTGRGPKETE